MSGESPYSTAPLSHTPSPLERIGATGLGTIRTARGLLATLTSALKASSAPGEGARRVCRGIAVRQIFYTSFQPLGLVGVIAWLVGATVVLQTELLAGTFQREMVGRVLIAVVLRELAPLVTTIIVAGRSGTAMATELGVMRVNSEVLGLASMGIDPPRFLVWPRVVASIVSIPVLTIYFSAIAVMGGYVAALVMGAHGMGELQAGLFNALTPMDLPLFFLKALGLGSLVGWLCCHHGLDVGASPTEVPIQVSRAVVQTLLLCIIYNSVVTGLFYWWMGPSMH